jgi:hypothetical protein
MPGFMSQISKFARSPQGKKAMDEAKRLAKDPKNRQQLDEVRKRFGQKAGRPPAK